MHESDGAKEAKQRNQSSTMVVPWGLLTLVFGGLYGYLSPGSQPKGRMLVNGLFIGLVLAIVFGLIGLTAGAPAFGLLGWGLFFDIVILTLLFVLGVWIGDLLESATTTS